MQTTKHISVTLAIACLLTVQPLSAQKAGQSISIQYGKVTEVRDVDLKSGACLREFVGLLLHS